MTRWATRPATVCWSASPSASAMSSARPTSRRGSAGTSSPSCSMTDPSWVMVSVANRIVDVLRSPFPIEGQDIVVGGSIGVAVGRAGLDRWRRAAPQRRRRDVHGQGRRQEPRLGLRADDACGDRRHALSAELSRSLGRGELVVYFQPIVEPRLEPGDRVRGAARWRHPTRGLVEPAEFIPLAEETGVIGELGRYVLEEACTQAARWTAWHIGPEPLTVAVNLSAQQLRSRPSSMTLRPSSRAAASTRSRCSWR